MTEFNEMGISWGRAGASAQEHHGWRKIIKTISPTGKNLDN